MKTKRNFIKSESEAENQFEVDEQLVDEIANSEEFKDVEVTNEDVIDAIQAIDALADAVIEKADVEEKELDADVLLDEVRDMIDETHEDEEELEEEEELPEELANSAVRVMVSEDGAVALEQTPDEVYNDELDGVECTVYDTCNLPPVEVEETGATDENTDDEMLVIGNSKAQNFKKGFLKIASSANKKAWSAAYKKVKKMVGSSKLTAAHWAIVSAIAKKEEEEDKKKKKIECAILKKFRSNKALKSKLLKSNDEFDPEGQPIAETKPEETVGEGNPGYEEIGEPTSAASPEEVDSQSGNPVTEPDLQNEKESDIVLPEGESVVVDVPLTNGVRKMSLKRIHSSARKNFAAYKVTNVSSTLAKTMNGKVLKAGKIAYVFKDTANGLLACAAKFVENGKGKYGTVLQNGKVVISKGEDCSIFNNVERFMNAKALLSARSAARAVRSAPAARKPISLKSRMDKMKEARRAAIRSRIEKRVSEKKALASRRELKDIKRDAVMSKLKARMELGRTKMLASQNESRLKKMHENSERQRLFQSSQSVMNEEKILIKQGANRNADVLSAMYKNMF